MNKKIVGFMWGIFVSFLTVYLSYTNRSSAWPFYVGALLLFLGYWFLIKTHKTSWVYRNDICGFEITLPARWDRGIFLNPYTPSFYGPSREFLKFAIGRISPEPEVQTQQNTLRRYAQQSGHEVLELGKIMVCGKEHATMLINIPGLSTVKNYSIVFAKREYLVSSNVEIADIIVQSMKIFT